MRSSPNVDTVFDDMYFVQFVAYDLSDSIKPKPEVCTFFCVPARIVIVVHGYD